MAYGNYPDLTRVRRVLVMKLRHLGDVLLTSPVFFALKKALPQAQIDAYVYGQAAPMLEGHPAISEILQYDLEWKKLPWLSRLGKEISVLRRIRNNQYDLMINLTEGDRGAMAARFSGAAIRVGVDQRKVYTHKVKNCPTLRHTVERQLDSLRRIGIFPSDDEKELFLSVPDVAIDSVRQRVGFEKFILIHPASRWRFKCWPAQKMEALAQRLIERGERIVFSSGPSDDEVQMVDEIIKDLPKELYCNLAGRLSLKELAALIQMSSALICSDSVPLHIASALKTPVVALFGPTSEITWGPWRNPYARIAMANMSCRPCYLDGCGGSKVCDCMQAIAVDQVLSELEVLAKIGAPGLRIIHELVDRPR
ncbi:MAG: putative lipopolysaccharide heptosyltransferase [Parachlamydiales bacterium]|nr:putative lipopolysaccharide heptosyltransferase [Parachlamydiales bacterium]